MCVHVRVRVRVFVRVFPAEFDTSSRCPLTHPPPPTAQDGKTALDWAREKSNNDIAALLEAGAAPRMSCAPPVHNTRV